LVVGKEKPMKAALNKIHFPELNEGNIRINLDLSKEDIAELKRTHIPAVLRLAELVVKEAEHANI
jgi:hypothetical protein